ncbi:MAG: hypothetical protein JSS65_12210 [Armatimonadetes bacterium]|nr:hypothetical protein [Armatimonadota bacterium]
MSRFFASVLALSVMAVGQAAVSFVGSKAELDPHAKFDLAYSGRPGTTYAGSLWMVLHGDAGPAALSGTLTAPGPFQRQDQGNTWQGDFASGEPIVWTAGHSNSFTFRTDKPMAGMGTYVSAAARGAYTAMIEAMDRDDHVLAAFTRDGFNDMMGDGDAPYLGVVSDSRNIQSIRLSIVGGGDLAISSVDVRPNPVPEPQLWAMASLGGVWWLRRRHIG